jgi:hypothetical protein
MTVCSVISLGSTFSTDPLSPYLQTVSLAALRRLEPGLPMAPLAAVLFVGPSKAGRGPPSAWLAPIRRGRPCGLAGPAVPCRKSEGTAGGPGFSLFLFSALKGRADTFHSPSDAGRSRPLPRLGAPLARANKARSAVRPRRPGCAVPEIGRDRRRSRFFAVSVFFRPNGVSMGSYHCKVD